MYRDFSKPGIDEKSPLAETKEDLGEEVTNEAYGPLKVLCEKAVLEKYPEQSTILRCGLIIGPHDPTDRFTYWPVRIQQGGEVMVPSPPHMQVQFIDATDLAHFILLLAKNRITGIYNTTGPMQKLTMEGFLNACINVTGSKASLTWVNEDFITNHDVDHIPVWTPSDWRGIFEVNCSKAIQTGLSFRPLEMTIKDTLDWHATRPTGYELKVGLKPERERKLLEEWHTDRQKW